MRLHYRKSSFRMALMAFSCVVSLSIQACADEQSPLTSYNAAIGESSISGISSGAFMAAQFGTAWSSVIKGVGVVAGGPFYCAQAQAADMSNGYILPTVTATGPCMQGPPPNVNIFTGKADEMAASGAIDPTTGVGHQKIYVFHGYNDAVVAQSVTDAAVNFYRHYLGNAGSGNLFYQTAIGAGHSLVVLDQPSVAGLNSCPPNQSPFINQCAYDQAGIILQHIYGALNPRNSGQLSGTMKSFSQAAYTQPDLPRILSMGDTGYVYVPKDCEQGAVCRVHIALHGCKQDAGDIGTTFIEDTGYNAWADTNHIIVLYPQTVAQPILTFPSPNSEACWDWWSYVTHSEDYVSKTGRQIQAIKAMLDALTVGQKPQAALPAAPGVAPATLIVTDTSDQAAALAWIPTAGADAYHISRADESGYFKQVGTVVGPSFGDAGLKPSRFAARWAELKAHPHRWSEQRPYRHRPLAMRPEAARSAHQTNERNGAPGFATT